MASAPMATKTLAMESLLPQAVREQWSTRALGDKAGVDQQTAARFLELKRQQAQTQNHAVIHKLSRKAGATFDGAAQRQLRRLERLNDLPEDHEWTRGDLYLEKHAIALLKPLMDWCKLRMDADPNDQTAPAQLSDGL